MIIEHIAGNISEISVSEKVVHTVEFTEEQMQKGHQRFRTQDGVEVAISLPLEEHLRAGALLELSDQEVVLIQAALQEVYVIRPLSAMGYGKVCYNIGNMHKKAYLSDQEILVPYDPILKRIFDKCEEPYEIAERRITGLPANVSAKEHAEHGHEHEHHHTSCS